MKNGLNSISNYNKIISRLKNKISVEEEIFLITRQSLTNNFLFYLSCIISRFIHLIIITEDNLSKNNKSQVLAKKVKQLTCYNLFYRINCSYNMYLIICIFFYIELLNKCIVYIYAIIKIRNKDSINNFITIGKFQIIINHIFFLFFPYIIEFLSFSYYIYFFPNKFFIKTSNISLFLIIIFNTILIIIYNIINTLILICSNKKYTTTEEEAYLIVKNDKEYNNKHILFKFSKSNFLILIILQNFVLFSSLEICLPNDYQTYYKIISKAILFFFIFLFIILNKYINYRNIINSFLNICFFYCFYGILINTILYLFKYQLNNVFNEMLIILQKLFLSILANFLHIFKENISIENRINQILFQQKNGKVLDDLIDSLIYLNEIMIKIKENNHNDSNLMLIKFLYKHINKCTKINCNCKLLINIIKKENNDKIEITKKEKLLLILNLFYESIFLEYNYYNKNNLTILLAEHYCHLKNNPTMAFSFINNLLMKKNNKLSIFENIELYELSQKYIYYIKAKEKMDKDLEIFENKKINLSMKERKDYFFNYFISIKISNKTNALLNKYIEILDKILKLKKIFKESLTFKFDENNESIDFVKINFFESNSIIDKIRNNKKESKKISNLYYAINLLNKEEILYDKIINYIKNINYFKDFPIFIIYKYYLFFDILGGYQIPLEISNKLYYLFSNNQNYYNSHITNKLHNLLKFHYNQQNNKINSKFFAMYKYKNDLAIKYFSEELALRLGYKRKDLINKKIDELMPKEFVKPHQNVIKKIFLEDQQKFYNLEKSYIFDSSKTVIYPIKQKGVLLYELSQKLTIISETSFLLEKEYCFMLNRNFEILALTKNFECEYFLNQQLFREYDLKLLNILQIKPENFHKKFENEFQNINKLLLIRKIKTEEYFVPKLYDNKEEEKENIFKLNDFNITRNQILKSINNSDNNYKYNENTTPKEENENLLKSENNNSFIYEYFQTPRKIIFHKEIHLFLNKFKFIENIFKELTKVPEIDLLQNKDNRINNSIFESKNLINKLLTKNDLYNNSLKITIRFSYYYNKPYYFISIKDDKKEYLKVYKNLIFKNNNINNKNRAKLSINHIIEKISSENSLKKTRNRNNLFINKNIETKNIIPKKFEEENGKEIKEINKNEKLKNDINKEKFIFIISSISVLILVIIIILYIIIIYFNRNSINIIEKIVLCYYYNEHIRAYYLNILSKINGLYHDKSGISPFELSNSHLNKIKDFANELRNKYHFFNNYFTDYNLDLGHSFNIIYHRIKFVDLKGLWKEILFSSQYSIEMEYIIYLIYLINDIDSKEFEIDINNFLFYKISKNLNKRIYTYYIKVLFYMTVNYEFSFKTIFNEINSEIFTSYRNYIDKCNTFNNSLEITSCFLYIIFFFSVSIYLYNFNSTILNNIIFFFVDFNEDNYDKINNNCNNIIKTKLLKLKYLIDDFDLNELQKYFEDLNNINNMKYIKEEKSFNKIPVESPETTFQKKYFINKKNKKEINKNYSKDGKFFKEENSNSQKVIDDISQNDNPYNQELRKINSNNSSYNYLVNSDSKFFKNNLNNNNLLVSSSNSIGNFNNYNKNQISSSLNDHLLKNKNDKNIKNESNINNNFYDAIINKSNKKVIPFIKIYIAIILILTIIMIFLSICIIINNLNYINQSNIFFNTFKVITTKYINLYFYFNNLKSLFIFNEEDIRWSYFYENLRNMNEFVTQSNYEYNKIINQNMNNYKEVKNLLNLFQYNNNDNLIEILKEKICQSEESCRNYLETQDNIFNVGIDSGYKISLTYINNVFMDYQKIKNKTDINEIISNITGEKFFELKRLRKAFINIFYLIQEMIYSSFEKDERNFNKKFKKINNILNFSCLIFSFIISLIIIFIIYTNKNIFATSFKNTIYRINHSFYNIRNYNRIMYL